MIIFETIAKLFLQLSGRLGDYIAADIVICVVLKTAVSVFSLQQYGSIRMRSRHLAQIEKIRSRKKEKDESKAIASYLSGCGYPVFGFAVGHFAELAVCALAAASFYPRFALYPEGAVILNGLLNLQDRPTNVWLFVSRNSELGASVLLFVLAIAAQILNMRKLNTLLVVEQTRLDNIYLLLVIVAAVLLPMQFCLLWTIVKGLDLLFLRLFCRPE